MLQAQIRAEIALIERWFDDGIITREEYEVRIERLQAELLGMAADEHRLARVNDIFGNQQSFSSV
jgi:hypothetical protein